MPNEKISEPLIHASCVMIGGKGVLIAGASGTGKSDLALRLIDEGAALIADDQTLLRVDPPPQTPPPKGGGASSPILIASAPASIAGLIEVRQVGLLRMPYEKAAPVALYIELAAATEKLERLPEEAFIELLGVKVRRLRLSAFEPSTPAKIRAALAYPVQS